MADLSFREQAEFWRRKVNVPTATWRDLQGEDHAHGFMVAGAGRQDLLDALRQAMDKVVDGNATIDTFRHDFDAIVARTGWQYNGGRNWRTRIIYETNLRTAYQAGRWQQMQAIKQRRPYWQYVHNDVRHPRPQHVAWNGKILSADDPWWGTHYPPNGYGCQCTVHTLAQRDMDRLGKAGPDDAPTPVDDTDGLDPGFNYNVGVAASSMPAAVRFGQKVMALPPAWRKVSLADAQTRAMDYFADWPGVMKRVTTELAGAEKAAGKAMPVGSAHALGFLRPAVSAGLEQQGATAGTALLGTEDRRVYHALRSAKGADADVLREALAQLPQWLADPATVVLWDTAEAAAPLVYAHKLPDGRWVKLAFAVDRAPESNRDLPKAKLQANWLRTAGLVQEHNLREAHYVRLDGVLE